MSYKVDGGPGSGNWGHAGRPGEVGGSAEGGGIQNRHGLGGESGYSSFAKERKKMATKHKIDYIEIGNLNLPGTRIVTEGGTFELSPKGGHFFEKFINVETGEFLDVIGGVDGRVLIPKESNPNYNMPKKNKDFKSFKEQYDKAFNPDTEQEADDAYRESAGKVWRDSSETAKKDLHHYTGNGFYTINKFLRENYASDNDDIRREVNNITKMIERNELDRDAIFPRGMSRSSFERMFNLPEGSLDRDTVGKLSGFTGMDRAFMSAGSAKRTGLENAVNVEIMCPKGTHALYVEPMSKHGNGPGLDWDGRSTQYSYGIELETIIQRNSVLTIIDGRWDADRGQYVVRAYVSYQQPVEKKKKKKKAATA